MTKIATAKEDLNSIDHNSNCESQILLTNEGTELNLLGYITPIITDYAENNRINPTVCYEVCHITRVNDVR